MIDDPVSMLRAGAIGTFETLSRPRLRKRFAGHMQLHGDGATIAIVASKKRDQAARWADDSDNNQLIAGITEAGTILAPVDRVRRSTTRGDYAVQVVRWHAGTILVNVPFEEVDGDSMTASRLSYLGLGSWSGITDHLDEPIVRDGEGVVGWKIEVGSRPERSAEIGDGYHLTVEHGWNLAGPYDNRSLQKPLRVGIRSEERRPIRQHVLRLDALHALLSVAHKKPVTAVRGTAQLAADSRERAVLWDNSMMDHAVETDTNDFPVFTLSDINDVAGTTAWVTTCLTKPRAVAPIVRHRLFQNQTPEARLLYTAAALEYWVASNARNPATPWAKKVSKWDVPQAIAGSVSDEWSDWIGHSGHWANLFSAIYNQLKHSATDIDVQVVDALEYSGRWLLTASILDQCAGTGMPSASIFGRGLPYHIAEGVRRALDGATVPDNGNRG